MKKLIIIILAMAPFLFAQETKLVTYKEYKFEFKGSEFEKKISIDPKTKDTIALHYNYECTIDYLNRVISDTMNLKISDIDIYLKHNSYNRNVVEKLSLRKTNNETGWLNAASNRYSNFGYNSMIETYSFTSGVFDLIYTFIKQDEISKSQIKDFINNVNAPDLTIIIREEVK